MIIIDTNVVSAMMRLELEPDVRAWMGRHDPAQFYISTPTIFEIHYGIAKQPAGRKRRDFAQRYGLVMTDVLGNRIVQFDNASAVEAGRIHALNIKRGHQAKVPDSQIAGIAAARGATIATRNIKDFTGLGISLINPWTSD